MNKNPNNMYKSNIKSTPSFSFTFFNVEIIFHQLSVSPNFILIVNFQILIKP